MALCVKETVIPGENCVKSMDVFRNFKELLSKRRIAGAFAIKERIDGSFFLLYEADGYDSIIVSPPKKMLAGTFIPSHLTFVKMG